MEARNFQILEISPKTPPMCKYIVHAYVCTYVCMYVCIYKLYFGLRMIQKKIMSYLLYKSVECSDEKIPNFLRKQNNSEYKLLLLRDLMKKARKHYGRWPINELPLQDCSVLVYNVTNSYITKGFVEKVILTEATY